MTSKWTERVNLPAWLTEAFEHGEPIDDCLIRRSESRHHLGGSFYVRTERGEPVLVRGLNLSEEGIGFISRTAMRADQTVQLAPWEGDDEPVTARIVHCTQTVQGYKVGCVFE